VNHSLFVAAQHVPQSWILLQRLAHSGNVPVPKDAKARFEETCFSLIPRRELVLQECDDGLRDSQTAIHWWLLGAIVGMISPSLRFSSWFSARFRSRIGGFSRPMALSCVRNGKG
jgi:hypothetical protein